MLPTLNLITVLGLSLISTAHVSAQSIGTVESGIDWQSANTFIRVNNYTPEHLENLANFDCFGSTTIPAQGSLSFLSSATESDTGTNFQKTAQNSNSCFHQAGDYDVTIQIADQAGNTRQSNFSLTIKADEPVSSQTLIAPIFAQKAPDNQNLNSVYGVNNCDQENLVANNLDNCQVQITFKDKFENIFIPDTGRSIDIEIEGKNDSITNLDLTNFPVDNFINGVNTNPESVSNTQADSQGSFLISLKSLSPTLEILTSSIDPLYKISRNTTYPVTLKFIYPEVGRDGVHQSTQGEFTQALSLQFLPWVRMQFSNQAPVGSTFTEPSQTVSMPSGEITQFYAFADTFTNYFLPQNFIANIKGFTSDNTNLDNLDLDAAGGVDLTYNVTDQAYQTSNFTTMGVQNSNIPGEKMSLSAEVDLDLYEGTTAYNITYPAGALSRTIGTDDAFDGQDTSGSNFDPDTDLTFQNIGVDVEGLIATQTGQNMSLATINFDNSDLREDLLKNIYSLVRGISPSVTTEFNLNSGFGDKEIAYIKDSNVRLTGSGDQLSPIVFSQGVKTLFVENGNVFIDRDILYPDGNVTNHLAIVLINSSSSRVLGNIFVNDQVQNFSGTLYADGSLISTSQTDASLVSVGDIISNRTSTNTNTPAGPLAKQLILHGTLFSKNTIGGSSKAQPVNPWQEAVTEAEAYKFDLNYTRRYVQPFALGLPIPDSQNNFCAKKNSVCDTNPASFIIRTNQLNQVLPAPGFRNFGTIRR